MHLSGGSEEDLLSADAFSSYSGSDELETSGNQGPVQAVEEANVDQL